MTIPLDIVDAFTGVPFSGNPAGVCRLDAPAGATWMAKVAREVNASETAFTWPIGPMRWGLRWFTPAVEVPLCGHATLATAHVLREVGVCDPDGVLVFETARGEITARMTGEEIELALPAYEGRPVTADEADAIRTVIGADVVEIVAYDPKVLARLVDRASVEALRPDLGALAQLGFEGLVVTAEAQGAAKPEAQGDAPRAVPGYVLRYFAPAAGVAEDPVTGSAQCAAAPFWAERTGETVFAVEQVSSRGGTMRVDLCGVGTVLISGRAVTILRGTLAAGPT